MQRTVLSIYTNDELINMVRMKDNRTTVEEELCGRLEAALAVIDNIMESSDDTDLATDTDTELFNGTDA